MALCPACKREMLKVDGCTYNYMESDDGREVFKRIKVGDPGDMVAEHCSVDPATYRCGDCGAKWGHYHHPGCDLESCPVCGEQLISCACNLEKYVVVKEK